LTAHVHKSSAQIARALKAKVYGENVLRKSLSPLMIDIVKSYRVGDTAIHSDAKSELKTILRDGYVKAANETLGIDYREYKAVNQILTPTYQAVSRAVDQALSTRAGEQAEYIASTISKWINKTSIATMGMGWTDKEASSALSHYLNSQRLLVASTETQSVVELVRRSTVMAVKDPLNNSVRIIAEMIKGGQSAEAVKLSKYIQGLLKLPLSQGQVSVMEALSDDRTALMTPYSQGQILDNIEARAEEAGKQTKSWIVSGYHTRASHWAAQDKYEADPIPIDEPFVLAGGMLMAPGDASLGASLSEICNCNCVANYL
jgi:hypothetical protein